jgi:hypothetical protein
VLRKWFNINPDVAGKITINCNIAVESRNMGEYLYKIGRNWDNKVSNIKL